MTAEGIILSASLGTPGSGGARVSFRSASFEHVLYTKDPTSCVVVGVVDSYNHSRSQNKHVVRKVEGWPLGIGQTSHTRSQREGTPRPFPVKKRYCNTKARPISVRYYSRTTLSVWNSSSTSFVAAALGPRKTPGLSLFSQG